MYSLRSVVRPIRNVLSRLMNASRSLDSIPSPSNRVNVAIPMGIGFAGITDSFPSFLKRQFVGDKDLSMNMCDKKGLCCCRRKYFGNNRVAINLNRQRHAFGFHNRQRVHFIYSLWPCDASTVSMTILCLHFESAHAEVITFEGAYRAAGLVYNNSFNVGAFIELIQCFEGDSSVGAGEHLATFREKSHLYFVKHDRYRSRYRFLDHSIRYN